MGYQVKTEHAIKSAIFAFEHLPLSQECLENLAEDDSAVRKSFKELPKFAVANGYTVTVGSSVQETAFIPQIPQKTKVGVVSFEKIGENGETQWAISIQENATVIFCAEYSRWNPTWEKVRGYLRTLIPYVLSQTTIRNAVLQYSDEFESIGDKTEFDIKEIISDISPYVTNAILNTFQRGAHCHTGFFENVDGIDGRVLHNININVIETQSQYQIQSVCSHRAHFTSPLKDINVDDVAIDGRLTKIFDLLHDKHKNVFGLILTDQAKEKVGFKSNKTIDKNGNS